MSRSNIPRSTRKEESAEVKGKGWGKALKKKLGGWVMGIALMSLVNEAQAQWFPPAIKVDGVLYTNATGVPRANALSSYTASSGSTLDISYDGSSYTLTHTPSGGSPVTGSFVPATNTFTLGAQTVVGVDTDEASWPVSVSASGPPSVWVNGSVWDLTSSASGTDTYTGGSSEALSITAGAFVISAVGNSTLDSVSGTYQNGTFYTTSAGVDIRSVASNGTKLTPTYGPSHGHPAELVGTELWQFRGTYTVGTDTFDLYAGNQAGQLLRVGATTFSLVDSQTPANSVSGSFNGLFYSGVIPVNVMPIDSSGETGVNGWEYMMYMGIVTDDNYHPYTKVEITDRWVLSSKIGNLNIYSGGIGKTAIYDKATGYVKVVIAAEEINETIYYPEFYAWGTGVNLKMYMHFTHYEPITRPTNVPPTLIYNNTLFTHAATYLDQYYHKDNNYYWWYYNNSYYTDNSGNTLVFRGYENTIFLYDSLGQLVYSSYSATFPGWTTVPSLFIDGSDYIFQVGINDHDNLTQTFQYVESNGGYIVVTYNSTYGYESNADATLYGYDASNVPIYGDITNGVLNYWFDWGTPQDPEDPEDPPGRTNPIFGATDIWIGGVKFTFVSGSDVYDEGLMMTTSSSDLYRSLDGGEFTASVSYYYNYETWSMETGGYYISGSSPSLGNFSGSFNDGSLAYLNLYLPTSSTPLQGSAGAISKLYANGRELNFSSGGLWTDGSLQYLYQDAGNNYSIQITIPSNGGSGAVIFTTPTGNLSGTYASEAFAVTGAYLATTQPIPLLGPAAIWVNGSVWYLSNTTSGDLYANDAGETLVLTGTVNQSLTATLNATSLSQSTLTGTYFNGVFQVAGQDIRPRQADGSFLPPAQGPAHGGPDAFWVNGHIWRHQGSSTTLGDLYVGDQTGQHLWVKNSLAKLTHPTTQEPDTTLTYSSANMVVNLGQNETMQIIPIDDAAGFAPTPGSGRPPGVWVEGVFLPHMGRTDGFDHYGATGTTQVLSISLANPGAVYLSGEDPSFPTGYFSSPIFFMEDDLDVRPRTSENLFYIPTTTPSFGPDLIIVDNQSVKWRYQGTGSHDQHQFDQYVGAAAGAVLWIRDDGQVSGYNPVTSQEISGTYANGIFSATQGANLEAYNQGGAQQTPRYAPATFTHQGVPWNYSHSTLGTDYYTGPNAGQVLSIGPNGAVEYTIPELDIHDQLASYANGQITDQNGGQPSGGGYGFVNSDLDIQGNTLSLGSWQDDSNMAGLTLQYLDSATGTTHVHMTSSRPTTDWMWYQAKVGTSATPATVMKLDAAHRLNLYSPTDGNAKIVLDPAGVSRINGAIRIEPQGDLEMGVFTASPN